jgi:hypothetical protein
MQTPFFLPTLLDNGNYAIATIFYTFLDHGHYALPPFFLCVDHRWYDIFSETTN